MTILRLAARFGPFVLIAGLVAGLSLPAFAAALQPWLPHMVAGLLFLAFLQIEPRALLGSLAEAPGLIGLVLLFQLAMPLAVLAAAMALGGVGPPALALALMTAAPAITGSPHVCLMLGVAPHHAMRLMSLGAAALPLTVLPVFWLMPQLGGAGEVFDAAIRLALTILAAAGLAMGARRLFAPRLSAGRLEALKGLSSIALAIFVIALMPPLAEALSLDWRRAAGWLALAFAANFGLQAVAWAIFRRGPRDRAVSWSVIAGNRNIALFLAALPAEATAEILVFIACYQAPMYLTPSLLKPLYAPR